MKGGGFTDHTRQIALFRKNVANVLKSGAPLNKKTQKRPASVVFVRALFISLRGLLEIVDPEWEIRDRRSVF